MDNAVEIQSLCYRPGKGFTLADLSITVPTGSVYGFLGPNGSGKTTTIKLLLGLLRGQRGTVQVLGHSIPRESAAAFASTGYVPEAPHLYQSFRVDEAMYYHAGFFGAWDDALAAHLQRRFELPMRQRLASLSKGEMRKLMILLAVAQRPRLLVLDEPTDGLDPVVRRDILDVLTDAVASAGITVFLSSHLVHELETICDWVAVLDKGNLVAELPMTQFRNAIKILRVANPPPDAGAAPFVVLRKTAPQTDGSEQWVVRGWQPDMTAYFDGRGASLTGVEDVDLESGFVELLRSFRVSART